MMTTLLALPKTYTIPALTPKAMFWMHRLIYFLFVDVFHGIIIPLIMLIPMDLKTSKVSEFYVRKPEIAPRRAPFEESRRIIIVGDHKASTSKNSKIFKLGESSGLYDNPQPSTSSQLPHVDSSPRIKPKPAQLDLWQYHNQPQPQLKPTQLELWHHHNQPQPQLKPTQLDLRHQNMIQVHPLEPELLPKMVRGVANIEKGGRRTTVYCRKCARKEKGKGRGKGRKTRMQF